MPAAPAVASKPTAALPELRLRDSPVVDSARANVCLLRIDGINEASTAGNVVGNASLFNDIRVPGYAKAAGVSGSGSKQVCFLINGAKLVLCLVGLKFPHWT